MSGHRFARRAGRLTLLAALALAGCEGAVLPAARSADVYEFRLALSPPVVLRWTSGSVVRVFVDSPTAEGRQMLAGALAHAGDALVGVDTDPDATRQRSDFAVRAAHEELFAQGNRDGDGFDGSDLHERLHGR